jgi:hypothetical protein
VYSYVSKTHDELRLPLVGDLRRAAAQELLKMTPTGAELARQYSISGDSAKCAAEINALAPDFGPIEPDLATVIDAWPLLSTTIRGNILATVQRAVSSGHGGQ